MYIQLRRSIVGAHHIPITYYWPMSTDHQDDTSQEQCHGLSVVEDRSCIAGWPTDTLSIDHIIKSDYDVPHTHTIIVFIPGNPGVIHWYTDTLAQIVQQVGKGYAARGLSYAGHGVGEEVVGTNEDHLQSFHNEHLSTNSNINRGISNTNEGKRKKGQRNMSISWTMEGQIEHKIAWIDTILNDWKREHNTTPNLIFISHSIGAHFVQSLLIRRLDLLANTQHIIHLTPFLRFDPPTLKKLILSSTANSYKQTIPIMTTLVRALSYTLPKRWIDIYLDKVACLHCTKGRKIALDIFMNEKMVRNHLVLGFQELRELCEYPNVSIHVY